MCSSPVERNFRVCVVSGMKYKKELVGRGICIIMKWIRLWKDLPRDSINPFSL